MHGISATTYRFSSCSADALEGLGSIIVKSMGSEVKTTWVNNPASSSISQHCDLGPVIHLSVSHSARPKTKIIILSHLEVCCENEMG